MRMDQISTNCDIWSFLLLKENSIHGREKRIDGHFRAVKGQHEKERIGYDTIKTRIISYCV